MEDDFLAYCDGKNVETLREHVDTMIKIYVELFKNRNFSKIVSEKFNIPLDVIEEAIKVTLVLHDIGKVFYQDRIRVGKGAAFHEYYSILVLDSLEHSIKNLEKIFSAIKMSIIMHHMSLRDPLTITKNISGYAEYYKAPLQVFLNEELSNGISNFLENYGITINFQEKVLKLSWASKMLSEILNDIRNIYPLSLRFTRVLIVTDNYAAALNRGGSPRKHVFLRDLPNWNSVYEVKERLRKWLIE